MLFRRAAIAMFLSAMGCPLFAHDVPSLTVETEFNAARQSEIRVNIDPRLFLTDKPTLLPPVQAAWWLEQDDAARAKIVAKAIAYLENILDFRIGDTALRGGWKVTAIDSASAFPLSANSSEVHLLAERKKTLPEVAGEFKVKISDECSVGVILLNSMEGKPERYPQSLFPGESSRGFKLPVLKSSAAVAQTVSSIEVKQGAVENWRVSPFLRLLMLALAVFLLLGFQRSRRRA